MVYVEYWWVYKEYSMVMIISWWNVLMTWRVIYCHASEFTPSSHPAEHSALFSDITSCGVVTQATESHEGGWEWAGHCPVECTEREILNGERRTPVNKIHHMTIKQIKKRTWKESIIFINVEELVFSASVQVSGVSRGTENTSTSTQGVVLKVLS